MQSTATGNLEPPITCSIGRPAPPLDRPVRVYERNPNIHARRRSARVRCVTCDGVSWSLSARCSPCPLSQRPAQRSGSLRLEPSACRSRASDSRSASFAASRSWSTSGRRGEASVTARRSPTHAGSPSRASGSTSSVSMPPTRRSARGRSWAATAGRGRRSRIPSERLLVASEPRISPPSSWSTRRAASSTPSRRPAPKPAGTP